jgi:fibronectin-binding autotransporter adhesin
MKTGGECNASQSIKSTKTNNRRWRNRALLIVAASPVAGALWAQSAAAQSLTWDSSGTATSTAAAKDGGGFWNTTTSANWAGGASDVDWVNGDTALFGNVNTTGTAGSVTINDASGAVTAAALVFNTPHSGSYTLAAIGGDSLYISGTTPTISAVSGVSATISAPISGAFGTTNGSTGTGLTINGGGTVTLLGADSYTGATTVTGNSQVVLGNGANVGDLNSNFYIGYFGNNPNTVDTSTLTMTATSTINAATLYVDYNWAEVTQTATGSAGALVINGNDTINANNIVIDAGRGSGNAKGGDGSLVLGSGATLTLHDAANDGNPVTLLDIANYAEESGGSTGTNDTGTVNFSAGTVNGTITTINIATGKAGTGAAEGTAATGILSFASGSLDAGTINIARLGAQAATGTLNLVAGSTGTITAGAINIAPATQGTENNGTTATAVINILGGTLDLGGDIAANMVVLNGTHTVTITSTINLNGGTLNMAGHNIGPSGSAIILNAASGLLENVNSINASGLGSAGLTTTGTAGQTLVLEGVNSYTGPTTIGTAGLVIANGASSMGAGGALAVNGGTLDLDGSSQSVSSLSGSGGFVTNNGVSSPVALTITNGSGTYGGVVENGASSGGLALMAGSEVLNSASAQTYSGGTSISSGASLTVANFNSSTAVTDSGFLAAAGTVGTINVNGGVLTPGTVATGTTGILQGGALIVGSSGASLNSVISSLTAFDELSVSSATFNGPLTLTAFINSPQVGTYTLLNSSTPFTLDGFTANTVPGTTRPGNSFQVTSTQIQLIIAGGPANLVWTDGSKSTNWENMQTDANWKRTDSGTQGSSNEFYDLDNVTFDSVNNTDSSPYTVNITSLVSPASTLFTNGGSTNYNIGSTNGSGIGGSGNLTVNSSDGTGTVTLNTSNSYTGATIVTAGNLVIGPSGSVAGSTFTLASTATTNVNAGGTLAPTTISSSGAFTDNGSVGGTNLTVSSNTFSVTSTGVLNTFLVNITGGSLTVQPSGTLTSGAVTVAPGASFIVQNGGVINSTGSNNLTLTNSGAVNFGGDETIGALNGTLASAILNTSGTLTTLHSSTYAGVIANGTSAGSLDVSANTVVLTGANTYSGTTTVGGILQIDAGANTGSLNPASAITDNGTVIYARTNNSSISNVYSGSGAIQQLGGGTLTLVGNNSGFSGAIQAYNGTIVQDPNNPNTFGSGSETLVVGAPGTATNTTTGSIILSASIPATSVAGISSTGSNVTASPPASVLNIPVGVTLTDTGGITVGAGFAGVFGTLQVTGGGSLAVSTSSAVTIGQSSDNALLDLTGLNNVNIATSGSINIGNGAENNCTLTLANTSVGTLAPVSIVSAATINMATTGTNTPAAAAVSAINLTSGSNTIEANSLNMGTGRGSAVIQFLPGTPSTASVTIEGQGGGQVAILLCNANTNGTFPGTGSFLNLAGYSANVQASSLTIAENDGNLLGGAIGGVTFDTGTFDVSSSVIVAEDIGGSSPNGPTGSITIGGSTPNNTATGTFTASGGIILGENTNGNGEAETGTATATLTLNGGNTTVMNNITNSSSAGNTVATLNLFGGGLDMSNGVIGTAASGNGFVAVNFPAGSETATLADLAGGGINNAGLTMNGTGTLILAGTNTYSGGTSAASGTLQVTSPAALPQNDNVTVGVANTSTGLLQLTSTSGLYMLSTLTINTGTPKGSVLDIGQNAILLPDNGDPADAEAAIQQYVESGQLASTTNGAIISSYAALNGLDVAYADAGDTNMTGSTLANNNPGDILIEPALPGDTDLNGMVNIHDLTNLLSNFNGPGFWDQGNFNGHATVDISDLQALLTNFNTSVSLTYAELSGIENLVGQFGFEAIPNSNGNGFALVAVPEPASVGLIAVAGFGLLARRRKHRQSL